MWPNGKASDYESGDSGFDPQHDQFFFILSVNLFVLVSHHVDRKWKPMLLFWLQRNRFSFEYWYRGEHKGERDSRNVR